jgi:hypothetical protein
LDDLRDKVDDLRLSLQLGKKMRVYASFRQFETLYRDASKLGQHVGGWHQYQHPQGQNDRARAPGQRANTLSSRPASMHEAKA